MWKLFAGFIVFALISLYVIMKGGDKIDMQGESAGHSVSASATATAPATVSASATATAPATASAPASASSAPKK